MMEESPFSQFRGDRRKGILTVGHEVMQQIRMLTGKGLQTPAAFQSDDLDAFYSDCDDVPSAKAVLMANLSSYDSDVLSEVSTHDFSLLSLVGQFVHPTSDLLAASVFFL
ncbi:hypothetical protein Tco_0115820 [Tanacetum coccineum]